MITQAHLLTNTCCTCPSFPTVVTVTISPSPCSPARMRPRGDSKRSRGVEERIRHIAKQRYITGKISSTQAESPSPSICFLHTSFALHQTARIILETKVAILPAQHLLITLSAPDHTTVCCLGISI